MPSIEQLFGAHIRNAPRATTGTWANRTTIDSGSASVTVSTSAINSDSIVQITLEVGSVSAVIGSGGGVVVNSIVSGTSFAIARPTGIAVPWDDTAMWTIMRTSG